VYGADGKVVRDIVARLEREVGEEREAIASNEGKGALVELFGRPENRRALGVACMLQGAQQLCGFVRNWYLVRRRMLTSQNTLMYFSATIFAMVGFRQPTATAMLIALTNFAFTIVALFAIDRIGRRRILLGSIPVMSLGLLLSALAFAYVNITSPDSSPPTASNETAAPWPALLVTSLLIFVAAYALGIGNVPWQQAELFTSLRVRALGSALATATNWGCNFVVAASFLPMFHALSGPITMLIYAMICAATWVGVWLAYPERAGVGLEVPSST
jgi:SP family myo-inositol transporter-like MFS transporter 13